MIRNWDQIRGRHHDLLRKPAIDFLADHVAVWKQVVDCDAFAADGIRPGDFVSESARERNASGLGAIVRVAVANAGGANLDQHFAGLRPRISDILRDQRRAVADQTDRSQRAAILSCTSGSKTDC